MKHSASQFIQGIRKSRRNIADGRSFRAILIALAMHAVPAAGAEAQQCFIPRSSEGVLFVDPGSKVCRAFEAELNKTCDGPIPIVEFQPSSGNKVLKLPDWHPIELYDKSGAERNDAFGLIAELVVARAKAAYVQDQDQLASRDLTNILRRVRSAYKSGGRPRFEKASIDLEGRGKKETIYRLYTGGESNPNTFSTDPDRLYGKAEPELFLERVIKNANIEDAGAGAGAGTAYHAKGIEVTTPSDVVIADGVPHLLRWSRESHVLVYSTYLSRDQPPIPGLTTYIIPQLRCLFEYQPRNAAKR